MLEKWKAYEDYPFGDMPICYKQKALQFINCLKHTKGRGRGQPFGLLPWQEQIIRDVFVLAVIFDELHSQAVFHPHGPGREYQAG